MMARIKIKDHDRRPEFSFAVVMAAAVIIWFVGALWSVDTRLPSAQRDLTQIRVTYQCDQGHRFVNICDTKSRPCREPECELRAWPVWSYQCSKHGAFLLQLRYTMNEQRRPQITKVKLAGGSSWQDVQDEISCSLCERVLVPDLSLRQAVNPPEVLK